jgi:(S)-2-hydroxyglutarate dehydrogenase
VAQQRSAVEGVVTMSTTPFDVVVIGGGIVGLSTAMHLTQRFRGATVVVVEKEAELAGHQTGHNSGVIHSGLYYKPGSLKAVMARNGSKSMVAFCQEHGITHEVCGKIVVATKTSELPQLEKLYQRGIENELPVRRISVSEAREIEPHVASLGAIRVESTGIADYVGVCRTYARLVTEAGGEIRLSTKVEGISSVGSGDGAIHRITTNNGDIEARFLVNCAGLYSDRMARMNGADPTAQIVPFRGEYFELVPHRRHLVKHLIYPVPNPDFPFLGVHFTRMIDGSVHAGPNAVLAFKREGYHKTDIDAKELAEILRYPGFHKLAAKNWREGMREMWRSVNRRAFVKSLQELIPEVTDADVVPTHAGVRAQALQANGGMVDDFLIVDAPNALHVCNAPSPAATASLEIGREIASRVPVGDHLKRFDQSGFDQSTRIALEGASA